MAMDERWRDFGKVHKTIWKRMLEIAHEKDLNRGGIYDARIAAINLWVAPEDKPSDWTFPITKGALNYPREFLGGIHGEYEGEFVKLLVHITNYSRERLARESDLPYEAKEAIRKLAREGTRAEWEWAERKVKELIDQAKEIQYREKVLMCPVCGRYKWTLLNEFIECLISHGIKVESVVMPTGLVINGKLVPFSEFEKEVPAG